jgi:hypothetical protein
MNLQSFRYFIDFYETGNANLEFYLTDEFFLYRFRVDPVNVIMESIILNIMCA